MDFVDFGGSSEDGQTAGCAECGAADREVQHRKIKKNKYVKRKCYTEASKRMEAEKWY